MMRATLARPGFAAGMLKGATTDAIGSLAARLAEITTGSEPAVLLQSVYRIDLVHGPSVSASAGLHAQLDPEEQRAIVTAL
ncbi:hypothetical protein [Vannielia litorea]|uniref:hypothetical protein n=1 Tax=Vannielia litorea TaxID=1217970 RepID=UPI0009416117|nr:hypothetical protein [Vannielia litorea]